MKFEWREIFPPLFGFNRMKTNCYIFYLFFRWGIDLILTLDVHLEYSGTSEYGKLGKITNYFVT